MKLTLENEQEIEAYFKFLWKNEEKTVTQTSFPIWKTVTAVSKDVIDFKARAKALDIKLSDYANCMIDKVDFSWRENCDLVKLSLKDMGFNGEWVAFEQIEKRSQELDLEVVPANIVLDLRLQYTEQPKGEWLPAFIKPIAGQDGSPSVFSVSRIDDVLWLFGDWADPGYKWSADYEIMFRYRKSL